MAIQWKDSYSTGVIEIDEQHKKLFDYINTFERNIRKDANPETIKELLEFLKNYTITHFGFEEDCMEKYKCPVAERNKEAHRRFLMAFDMLQRRFNEEGAEEMLLRQIHTTAENWLINHIGDIDTHLRTCPKPH